MGYRAIYRPHIKQVPPSYGIKSAQRYFGSTQIIVIDHCEPRSHYMFVIRIPSVMKLIFLIVAAPIDHRKGSLGKHGSPFEKLC